MSSLPGPTRDHRHSLADDVVSALTAMFPDGAGLHEPEFGGNEWAYVKECIDTGWVSTAGEFVDQFEQTLCDLTGSPYAIATVNGTAALHICLILAGVRTGDEVIVPGLSFVATANAVSYCGAIPHFADIELETLGLDAGRLGRYLEEVSEWRQDHRVNKATGRPIRAVVCMHTFGHPTDLDSLMAVCAALDLPLIEDAAESLGSLYRGRHTGTFTPFGALSFNGNKIATTGGGGAVLAQDPDVAAAAKHLTTTAKVPHAFEFIHDQVGYNYRMPNLNAGLGCAQLERLSDFVSRKRRLADHYARTFENFSEVSVFTEPAFAQSNYWLNNLMLAHDETAARNTILKTLNENGIMARAAWTPINRLPMYANCPAMPLPVVDDVYARALALPSSPALVEGIVVRS